MIELYQLDSCPLCGGMNWRDCIYVFPRESEVQATGVQELKYCICQCGYIFADRYIKDLDEYYRSVYREMFGDGVTEHNLDAELARACRLCPEIVQRKKFVGKALDVGSSSGVLLLKLRGYYNCQALGVELSDCYRKYSLDSGISTIDDLDLVSGVFDLITCIHVLEHQVDPLGFLAKLVSHGTRDTVFVIEVPFFDPRISHAALYSRAIFEEVLRKGGLEIFDMILEKNLTAFARRRD